MNKWLRITLVLAVLLILFAGYAKPAHASVFDDDGRIDAGEVIDDDVFLSGDTVIMDGTVNGLLLAAGETVTINGTVNGDLFLFGNNVTISPGAKIDGNLFVGSRTAAVEGQISGSVFGGAASARLSESASIGRNLYYGGYSFETVKGSQVNRDLFVGGYQAILAGQVGRDAGFGGRALEFNGSVGRDLKVDVGDSEGRVFLPDIMGQPDLPAAINPGIRVSEGAKIGNQLVYTSRTPQTDTIQAVPPAGVVFQTPVPNRGNQAVTPLPPAAITVRYPVLDWLWNVVREAITLIVFGALALWLLPKIFEKTITQARNHLGPSAGYGLLTIFGGYFIMLVAVVLILMIGILLGILSLGGLSFPVFGVGFSTLALFAALFTLLVGTISKVIVSFLIGKTLLDRAAPQSQHQQIWSLIAGVLIYVLVRSIPIVGWIIGLAATLVGVGAMWLAYQAWRNSANEAPLIAAPQ